MLLIWLLAITLELYLVLSESFYHRVLRQIEFINRSSCITPNNDNGTCINIKNCESLLNLMSTNDRNPHMAHYLQKSQCGLVNGVPKICCPENASVSINISTSFAHSGSGPNISPRTGNGILSLIDASHVSARSGRMNLSNWSECGKVQSNDLKIVGGRNSTKGEWPWMVALGYRTSTNPGPYFRCGASLISNRYVITAAHCVQDLPHGFKLTVARLGDLDLNPNVEDGLSPIDVPVENITVHPEYSTRPIINDIALIRLANDVQFTEYCRPICLLSGAHYRRNEYYKRKQPFALGWGALQWNGPSATALQQTTISIVDNARCSETYSNERNALIDNRVLCAGSPGRDTCQGDSGGPLIFPNSTETKFYLGGIVSYGIKCSTPGLPGVYTRIAEFIDWINQVTEKKF